MVLSRYHQRLRTPRRYTRLNKAFVKKTLYFRRSEASISIRIPPFLVAIGWQSSLRCSNSQTGAFVTAACNALRFNVGLIHQNGCSHFGAVAWNLDPKWHQLEGRPFRTVTHTLPYTWPPRYTVISPVADPDQAFGGGQSNWGAPKRSSLA